MRKAAGKTENPGMMPQRYTPSRLSRFFASLKGFVFGGAGGGSGYGVGGFGGFGWGWGNNSSPGSSFDYLDTAQNLHENGVVSIGLKWEADAFAEAPFCVTKRTETGNEIIPNHPLTKLIRKPNPFWDETLLMSAIRMSLSLAGNAYLLKVRSAAGKTVELWWVPHWMMRPVWKTANDYITGYLYTIEGKNYLYSPDDIIHFRDGVDPRNSREGLSKLAAVVRSVCTDNEAESYSASILRNHGVVGAIFSPKVDLPGSQYTKEQLQTMKQGYMDKTTGDRAGEPFFMMLPFDVVFPDTGPEKLALDKLRRIPETRISAAMKIPAIVLGLDAGLQHATYSNYETALRAAYHHNTCPAWRIVGSTFDRQLLNELGDPETEACDFDTSQVQALQEDRDNLSKRSAILYTSGVAMRSDSRRMVSLDTGPEDDVYIQDIQAAKQAAQPALKPGEDPAEGTDPEAEQDDPALPPGAGDESKALPESVFLTLEGLAIDNPALAYRLLSNAVQRRATASEIQQAAIHPAPVPEQPAIAGSIGVAQS